MLEEDRSEIIKEFESLQEIVTKLEVENRVWTKLHYWHTMLNWYYVFELIKLGEVGTYEVKLLRWNSRNNTRRDG